MACESWSRKGFCHRIGVEIRRVGVLYFDEPSFDTLSQVPLGQQVVLHALGESAELAGRSLDNCVVAHLEYCGLYRLTELGLYALLVGDLFCCFTRLV